MKMVKNIVFPARSRANYFFIALALSDNDDKVYDKADCDDDGVYNFDHDDDAVAALVDCSVAEITQVYSPLHLKTATLMHKSSVADSTGINRIKRTLTAGLR